MEITFDQINQDACALDNLFEPEMINACPPNSTDCCGTYLSHKISYKNDAEAFLREHEKIATFLTHVNQLFYLPLSNLSLSITKESVCMADCVGVSVLWLKEVIPFLDVNPPLPFSNSDIQKISTVAQNILTEFQALYLAARCEDVQSLKEAMIRFNTQCSSVVSVIGVEITTNLYRIRDHVLANVQKFGSFEAFRAAALEEKS